MGHQAGNNGMQIVRPMTENTAQWAAGFLFASAPELARFTIAMMNDGMIDGKQAFSAGAVRRVTTGYVPHPGGSGLDSAMYGYGLVVGRAGKERVWTHGGAINGYNASVTMLPDRKSAVIVIVNGPGAGISAIEKSALQMAVGYTAPSVSTPKARDATAAERAALIGRYSQGRNEVELIDESGVLKLRRNGSTMPVQLVGSTQLVASMPDGSPMRVYVRFDNGRAGYLYSGSRAFARQ